MAECLEPEVQRLRTTFAVCVCTADTLHFPPHVVHFPVAAPIDVRHVWCASLLAVAHNLPATAALLCAHCFLFVVLLPVAARIELWRRVGGLPILAHALCCN